jgi:molybdopterin molybdotransferase
LLATHGVRAVAAHRRPSVAFATTGDEVVAPECEPAPGQIRDSHSDFFRGACARLGLEARSLGIVPDRPEALRETIALGIAEHDVLLLSGGVSMGAFDLVEGVLAELGCRVLLDAVAIQPGKPMVAARHARGWVFALPGNPASAMVTFWLFVRPALRRLMGASDGYWHGALEAVLGRDLPGAKGRDLFLPGRARFGSAGQLEAWPLLPKGSHDVAAYGVGSLLIRVPARSEPTPAGERCSVLPLVEWLEH